MFTHAAAHDDHDQGGDDNLQTADLAVREKRAGSPASDGEELTPTVGAPANKRYRHGTNTPPRVKVKLFFANNKNLQGDSSAP